MIVGSQILLRRSCRSRGPCLYGAEAAREYNRAAVVRPSSPPSGRCWLIGMRAPPATVHGAASTIVHPRLGRVRRGIPLWSCSPRLSPSFPCRRRLGGPGASWSLGRAASLASLPARGHVAGRPGRRAGFSNRRAAAGSRGSGSRTAHGGLGGATARSSECPWPCPLRDVSALRPLCHPGRWRRGNAASRGGLELPPPVQSRVSHVAPPCEPACCARARRPPSGPPSACAPADHALPGS